MKPRIGIQTVKVDFKDLLDLKEAVKQKSFLKNRCLNDGKRSPRLVARGMEFAESRRYLPGDDVRNIDWRVTARSGKAHTKLFSEEKDVQVSIALDLRDSMFFGTRSVFKSVQAALLAGCFSWSSLNRGHLLSGILFNENGYSYFKPASLKNGGLEFLKGIAKEFEERKRSEDKVNFEKVLELLLKDSAKSSILYMISDFKVLSDYELHLILQIAKKTEVVLLFIYDRFEKELPINSVLPVFDGEDEFEVITTDMNNVLKYQNRFQERKNRLSSLSRNAKIHFIECSTEENCLEVFKKGF